MKRRPFVLMLVLLALLSLLPAVTLAQEGSITTTFAGGNSFAGNIFDVTALTGDITITGFDVHIGTTDSETIEIYYRPGSYAGFEDSPAGWTLLGTDTVTGQGEGTPTPVDIGGLTIPQGETYGIYVNLVTYDSGGDMVYSDDNTAISNGDVMISAAIGKGDPAFTGANNFPRMWNGTIYYVIGAVADDDDDDDDGPVIGPPCFNLFDGRINDDQSKDCAAPVAIYLVDGRVDVYAVDPNNGRGTLVMSSAALSAEATVEPGAVEASGNSLLGSSGSIRLYWLPATQEYLLQATYADGKPYEVVWSGDGANLRHTTA